MQHVAFCSHLVHNHDRRFSKICVKAAMASLALVLSAAIDWDAHVKGEHVVKLTGSPVKIVPENIEQLELLLHGLVRAAAGGTPMREASFHDALQQIELERNVSAGSAPWHRNEAIKLSVLFQFAMRAVKRPGCSRFLCIHRLRRVYLSSGGRLTSGEGGGGDSQGGGGSDSQLGGGSDPRPANTDVPRSDCDSQLVPVNTDVPRSDPPPGNTDEVVPPRPPAS